MDTPIFEIAIKRHEEELSNAQNLDQKASNLIGFAGIIIAIFSFVIGSNGIKEIANNEYFSLLILGIVLILCAIGAGIVALTKIIRKVLHFDITKFYDLHKDDTMDQQKEEILNEYLKLIDDCYDDNKRRTKILYAGNILSISGLALSFASMLLILKSTS